MYICWVYFVTYFSPPICARLLTTHVFIYLDQSPLVYKPLSITDLNPWQIYPQLLLDAFEAQAPYNASYIHLVTPANHRHVLFTPVYIMLIVPCWVFIKYTDHKYSMMGLWAFQPSQYINHTDHSVIFISHRTNCMIFNQIWLTQYDWFFATVPCRTLLFSIDSIQTCMSLNVLCHKMALH